MRKVCLLPMVLLATVGLLVLPAGAAVAGPSAGDRVTNLPQIASASGARVESVLTVKSMGYTVVLRQFKSPLVPAAVRRGLPAHDTVLQFEIRWRHGERRLSGLLHAFRHGTQLHLAVHQKVYLTDSGDGAATTRPRLVPFGLEGTVEGVRADARGFLVGNRVHLDFNATLPGDLFGTRMILDGRLSVLRIGL